MDFRMQILMWLVCFIIIILYLSVGMMGKYGYEYKGWIFAPARCLRKFLCGMILGHKYANGKCIHCHKRQRKHNL